MMRDWWRLVTIISEPQQVAITWVILIHLSGCWAPKWLSQNGMDVHICPNTSGTKNPVLPLLHSYFTYEIKNPAPMGGH
jgi:hypothetical protein